MQLLAVGVGVLSDSDLTDLRWRGRGRRRGWFTDQTGNLVESARSAELRLRRHLVVSTWCCCSHRNFILGLFKMVCLQHLRLAQYELLCCRALNG